jgi:co-chaperonin GroES (HSP10)
MTFTPVNNHLHVRVIEERDTEDTGILLPQDYRPVDKPFAAVRVLGASMTGAWVPGSLLVVEAQMLRDIEHNGETFTVVKENYVIGVLS